MMSLAQAGKAKEGRLSHEPKDLAPEGLDRGYEDSTLWYFPEGVSGENFRFNTPFLFSRTRTEKEYFYE